MGKFSWLWGNFPICSVKCSSQEVTRVCLLVTCSVTHPPSRACVCLGRERKQGTNPSLCPIFGPLEQPLSQILSLSSTAGTKRRGLHPSPFSAPPNSTAELPLSRATFVRENTPLTQNTTSWGMTQIGGHYIFTPL